MTKEQIEKDFEEWKTTYSSKAKDGYGWMKDNAIAFATKYAAELEAKEKEIKESEDINFHMSADLDILRMERDRLGELFENARTTATKHEANIAHLVKEIDSTYEESKKLKEHKEGLANDLQKAWDEITEQEARTEKAKNEREDYRLALKDLLAIAERMNEAAREQVKATGKYKVGPLKEPLFHAESKVFAKTMDSFEAFEQFKQKHLTEKA